MDQECLYANKKNTKIFGRGVCGTCCAVHFTIENTNADAPALIFIYGTSIRRGPTERRNNLQLNFKESWHRPFSQQQLDGDSVLSV